MLKKNTYSTSIKKMKCWALADTFLDFYKMGFFILFALLILTLLKYINFSFFLLCIGVHIILLTCAIFMLIQTDSYQIKIIEESLDEEDSSPSNI